MNPIDTSIFRGKIYTLPIKPVSPHIWEDYTIDGDMFWYFADDVTCSPNTEFECPECGKVLFCLDDFNWINLGTTKPLCDPFLKYLKQVPNGEYTFKVSCKCGWSHGLNIFSHDG